MAGGPGVLNDVHAKSAIMVNIWMEHFRSEANSWRLLGIMIAEDKAKREDAAFPGCFIRAKNGGAPHEQVFFTLRASTATLGGFEFDGFQI